MAIVASESSHAGRPNADFWSPKSDFFLVVVSLGLFCLWKLSTIHGIASQKCAVSWEMLSALGQGSDLLLQVGQDAALFLELLLLLIQPPWKVRKQIFVQPVMCHFAVVHLTLCQVEEAVFAGQGQSQCVLCGLSPGWFTRPLLLHHCGWGVLCCRFWNLMEKIAPAPSQLFSFETTIWDWISLVIFGAYCSPPLLFFYFFLFLSLNVLRWSYQSRNILLVDWTLCEDCNEGSVVVREGLFSGFSKLYSWGKQSKVI